MPRAGRPLNAALCSVVVLANVAACTPASETPAAGRGAGVNELLKTFVDELVPITPGRGEFPKSFEMGSDAGPRPERPPHTVTFDYEFAVAKYEVPQNLYEAVIGSNPSTWKGPRNSAEMMTWQEAVVFCRRLTDLLREAKLIAADEEIRLPTEAEWEFCCRAGTTTPYSFGAAAAAPGSAGGTSLLDEHAWHTGNAAGNDPPVGALKPNPWGLYDMHGYLWEFVADAWHPDYADAPSDGRAWDANTPRVQRVMRGGSWVDLHTHLTSTTRWPIPDHARSAAIGFRCVKSRPRRLPDRR
jgi:formylglycine-generating enzyme required for sulfatase activity